jgi:hypothetical protein
MVKMPFPYVIKLAKTVRGSHLTFTRDSIINRNPASKSLTFLAWRLTIDRYVYDHDLAI